MAKEWEDTMTAVIAVQGVPSQRIPIHGMNRAGVIAWTEEQHSNRTFEIIPWHRVESVTVTMGSFTELSDFLS